MHVSKTIPHLRSMMRKPTLSEKEIKITYAMMMLLVATDEDKAVSLSAFKAFSDQERCKLLGLALLGLVSK